jgi:hypothetical protein
VKDAEDTRKIEEVVQRWKAREATVSDKPEFYRTYGRSVYLPRLGRLVSLRSNIVCLITTFFCSRQNEERVIVKWFDKEKAGVCPYTAEISQW